MSNFYVEKDNTILACEKTKQQLETCIKFRLELKELEIQTTDREIITRKGKFVFADEVTEELLQEAKQTKLDEATTKAYDFETTSALVSVQATNFKTKSSEIYHIEAHLTNLIKISAYAQSMSETDVLPWNTKENVNIMLDKKGCALLARVMQKMNIELWTVNFPQYVGSIESAETVEDVEAILIDYDHPQEILDIRIEGVTDENPTNEDSSNVPQEPETSELQTEPKVQKKSSGEIE